MKPQNNTVERAGAEQERLAEARERKVPWRKWGPYLSEPRRLVVRPAERPNLDSQKLGLWAGRIF